MTAVVTDSWRCLLGENEWCTAADPCFTCADHAHAMRAEGGLCPPDCRECKLRSLQIGPQVGMETRGRKFAPLGPKGDNSWERGIATDARGVPFVNADGSYVSVKQYGEQRHKIEAARHRTQQEARVLSSTTAP